MKTQEQIDKETIMPSYESLMQAHGVLGDFLRGHFEGNSNSDKELMIPIKPKNKLSIIADPMMMKR